MHTTFAYCYQAGLFHSIAFILNTIQNSVIKVTWVLKIIVFCHQITSKYHLISLLLVFTPIFKMKIFQSNQRHFTVLGITVEQSRKPSSFSFKHLTIILIILLCITALFMCIIFLADSFEEYTVCIYGIFTIGTTEIELALHVWKLKQIFKFIENFEHLIESSELNTDGYLWD